MCSARAADGAPCGANDLNGVPVATYSRRSPGNASEALRLSHVPARLATRRCTLYWTTLDSMFSLGACIRQRACGWTVGAAVPSIRGHMCQHGSRPDLANITAQIRAYMFVIAKALGGAGPD